MCLIEASNGGSNVPLFFIKVMPRRRNSFCYKKPPRRRERLLRVYKSVNRIKNKSNEKKSLFDERKILTVPTHPTIRIFSVLTNKERTKNMEIIAKPKVMRKSLSYACPYIPKVPELKRRSGRRRLSFTITTEIHKEDEADEYSTPQQSSTLVSVEEGRPQQYGVGYDFDVARETRAFGRPIIR